MFLEIMAPMDSIGFTVIICISNLAKVPGPQDTCLVLCGLSLHPEE